MTSFDFGKLPIQIDLNFFFRVSADQASSQSWGPSTIFAENNMLGQLFDKVLHFNNGFDGKQDSELKVTRDIAQIL